MGWADEDGAGCSCTKTLLMLFNALFWVMSCVIIALSLVLIFDNGARSIASIITQTPENLTITSYVLLGAGIFQFFMSYAGCYGSMKEIRGALAIFIFSVLLIILAEVAAVVLIIVFQEDIMGGVKPGMTTSISNYGNETTVSVFWNIIQTEFDCCGVDNSTDFSNSSYELPCTCFDGRSCKIGEGQLVPLSMANETIFDKGCYSSLKGFFDTNIPTFIGVACGFGGLEIIGFILAIVLCCRISPKHKKDRGKRPSQIEPQYQMDRRYTGPANYR